MEILPLARQNEGAFAPAASPAWANFTAFGPGAARTALVLSNRQSWDNVRALSLLASDLNHDAATLGRISDAWLSDDADNLLSPISTWDPSDGFGLNPNPPADRAWRVIREFGVENTIDAGPATILPPITASYGWGAGPLASSIFQANGRIATLGQQAHEANPPAETPAMVPVPRTEWKKQDFKASAALLGGGVAGVLAGTVAHAAGLSTGLSIGIGAAATGAGLFALVNRLDDVDYSNSWTKLAEIPGVIADKVVDTALGWLDPGTNVGQAQAAPVAVAASVLPLTMTSQNETAWEMARIAVNDAFA